MQNNFFNAHHSPIGAFASFTLGFPGNKGGLGLELGKPADQNIYIGLETAKKDVFEALPFFQGFEDDRARFDLGIGSDRGKKARIISYPKDKVSRSFNVGSDSWKCGNLEFTIFSPLFSIPDPQTGSAKELRKVLLPAVMAEITIDNTDGKNEKRFFFGFSGSDPYSGMRRLDETTNGKIKGVGQGRHLAIVSREKDIFSGLGFSMEDILSPVRPENLTFMIGMVGALVGVVPAGRKKSFKFAACFHRDGFVTSGLDTQYYYTKFFKNIEQVAHAALEHFDDYKKAALKSDSALEKAAISDNQKFMLSHSIRSYYGSTQLLIRNHKPVWVVNEGEYRMMNTLDLTADHLFYEVAQNPWVVRNALDLFASRYSYYDHVRYPDDEKEYPGGISFTHDMGISNVFSRPQHSCYEQFGLKGCFSHMTQEQLANWLCCASVYYQQTKDGKWLKKNSSMLADCLESMLNRDDPMPEKRDGLMSTDSSRTMGGSEITTYDSLDVSLGQARNNVYLAVKCLAAYLGLEKMFAALGKDKNAQIARKQAERCAETLLNHVDPKGLFPAVINEGVHSRIIPVVESLAFVYFNGNYKALQGNVFSDLLKAFRKHLNQILVKGICLFEDDGWKLSSTSDNSWLSKIYACQFVARKILGLQDKKITQLADAAHVRWLLHPEKSYWAWSDQMVKGVAEGSKYYPRGVTSFLWLYEKGESTIKKLKGIK